MADVLDHTTRAVPDRAPPGADPRPGEQPTGTPRSRRLRPLAQEADRRDREAARRDDRAQRRDAALDADSLDADSTAVDPHRMARQVAADRAAAAHDRARSRRRRT